MVFRKLPKPRQKLAPPLPPITADAALSLPPETVATVTPLPTLSVSANATQTQLTHFLKTHLKPSFMPQDLLFFLKNRLHHPKFTHFDLHVFRYAATLDFFRHDHSTFEWMVRTLAITDRFDGLQSVLEFMVLRNPRMGVVRYALTQTRETDDWRRHAIFHTYTKINDKGCKVIVDSGSCINAVSSSIVAV